MSKTHKLKLMEEFADDVCMGYKSFEVRVNDRDFQKGDTVQFVCVTKTGIQVEHAIDSKLYEITYMLSGWGIKEGYVVFGIREVQAMMSDELTTSAAIAHLESIIYEDFAPYTQKCLMKVIEATQQNKVNKWIPCSERLPEMCGMPCLLTAVNGFGQIRVIKGFTNYMEGGKFRFLSNEKDFDLDCWNVIAWMPLPEPYKEER